VPAVFAQLSPDDYFQRFSCPKALFFSAILVGFNRTILGLKLMFSAFSGALKTVLIGLF